MANNEATTELKEILEQYDLGELVDLERDKRGTVNTSFAIQTVRGDKPAKYFLRMYKKGIREAEIQFEHSLIDHLVRAKSPPVARIFRTRQGKTYLRRFDGAFFAIFEFLPDEDRYTWVSPHCSGEELANSAIVLAQFHNAVSGFKPEGQRNEPKIVELLPQIASNIATCPERSKHTAFDACLLEHLDMLLRDIDVTLAKLSEPGALELPQLIIHCDYHPGNLKFRGSQVTGLFDFDWSKVDARCFDVALALWYFCTNWGEQRDGELRLQDVKTFLVAYQGYLQSHIARPLSPVEGKYLPHMINASNLYVLNWAISDYYQKDNDPQEYLTYLRHNLNFTRWFTQQDNLDRLKAIISPLTGSV